MFCEHCEQDKQPWEMISGKKCVDCERLRKRKNWVKLSQCPECAKLRRRCNNCKAKDHLDRRKKDYKKIKAIRDYHSTAKHTIGEKAWQDIRRCLRHLSEPIIKTTGHRAN